MKPEGPMSHSKGLLIPILSRINPFLVLILISLTPILLLSSQSSLDLPIGLCPIILTNSMAYETRRFNVAFTRLYKKPYPELNQTYSSHVLIVLKDTY